MKILFMVLLFITAVFLILLILIQRGKGGGLAGAFGGMGGQSAFGTKAGDLFTKITIGLAAFWIILCLCSVAFLKGHARMDAGMGGGMGGGAPGTQSESSDTPAPQGESDSSK
jgi:preprotein translocase subunit SecG